MAFLALVFLLAVHQVGHFLSGESRPVAGWPLSSARARNPSHLHLAVVVSIMRGSTFCCILKELSKSADVIAAFATCDCRVLPANDSYND